jgi:hypothetical protein
VARSAETLLCLLPFLVLRGHTAGRSQQGFFSRAPYRADLTQGVATVFDDIDRAENGLKLLPCDKKPQRLSEIRQILMVYLGLASAGCEPRRKAQKRCGLLDQPACARCIRLKKACSGYRSIRKFEIQDESEAVMIRVTGQNRSLSSHASVSSAETRTTSIRPGITLSFLPWHVSNVRWGFWPTSRPSLQTHMLKVGNFPQSSPMVVHSSYCVFCRHDPVRGGDSIAIE